MGSIVFVTFIFWQYFYKAQSEELAELEEKLQSLETQIANEQRLAQSLDSFRKEIKNLEARLESALKQLPDKREIDSLLGSVATLAKDAGLQVTRFAPKPDVTMDFYAAVPVDVALKGTYHQIATFFDEVAGLSRIVNVSDVVLKNPQGVEEEAHVEVEGGCTVTTFRYLDESERVSAEEPEAGPKKKGKAKKKKKK